MTGDRATPDPADVTRTYFESWQARDFDTLRSVLADDATFTGPLGTASDADGCVAGLRRMADILDEIAVQHVFVDGPDVLTWFDLRTTVAPATPTANWSRVENGRITRIRVAFDARALAEALRRRRH